jgi:hypothetical protein
MYTTKQLASEKLGNDSLDWVFSEKDKFGSLIHELLGGGVQINELDSCCDSLTFSEAMICRSLSYPTTPPCDGPGLTHDSDYVQNDNDRVTE